jgi:replicative DNA helicase Mcm
MVELIDEDVSGLWNKFFVEYSYNIVLSSIANEYPDTKSLNIDFRELQSFDSDLAELLLREPQRALFLGERTLEAELPEEKKSYNIHIRVKNLPGSQLHKIRDLRAKHMTEFLKIEGIVRMVTDVRPRIREAAYECKICGHVNYVIQNDEFTLDRPHLCEGCKKSKIFELDKDKSYYIDSQRIEIQELPEELKGGQQPQKILAYLEDDLTKGEIMPGKKITIVGTLKPISKSSKNYISQYFDLYLDINNYEFPKEEYEEISLMQEDLNKIIELSKSENLFNKLINSIAETIYGMDVIKEAMLLQMFGGVTKIMPDDTRLRGDIHILLVGDPGTAKSQLLRFVRNVVPKGIYTSGKSSSAAGLTAAATRDEFGDGRWNLEAGTLVLADMGIAAIDEFEKMEDKDRSSIHEAMEQQTITVAKAGINATLMARCGILAAANPKHGRFDPSMALSDQIKLEGPLLSRFDAIFKIIDVPDSERDSKIAEHILSEHQLGERMVNKMTSDIRTEELEKNIIPYDLFRKYVAYAKRIVPELTNEAMDQLKKYYLSVRSKYNSSKAIPITPRQLEAMVRLAEASARVRLSKYVNIDDTNRAIRILEAFMSEVATEAGGVMDIDMIGGISKKQRTKMEELEEIIKNLTIDGKSVSVEDIVKEAEAKGLNSSDVTGLLSKMKRDGLLYEPYNGRFLLTG